MYRITPEILREIAGASVNRNIVEGMVEHLPEILDDYNINTKLRISHFLAQLAHESDHFRTFEEYASGDAYEGRRDLGNVKRGDGRRYKGRGPIQLTGRFNYRKYGKILGVDLENNPHLASSPKVGLQIAAEYWTRNGLNALADADNGKQITRRINGGYNGLDDRMKKIRRAKRVMQTADWVQRKPEITERPDPKPLHIEEVEEDRTPQVVTVDSTIPIFAQEPFNAIPMSLQSESNDDSNLTQQQLDFNNDQN
jgi:putative chitinase